MTPSPRPNRLIDFFDYLFACLCVLLALYVVGGFVYLFAKREW